METLKNFLVGVLVTFIALLILTLGFLLWPIVIGLGSFLLFMAAIILGLILGFYIIAMIGYVVRKGIKENN